MEITPYPLNKPIAPQYNLAFNFHKKNDKGTLQALHHEPFIGCPERPFILSKRVHYFFVSNPICPFSFVYITREGTPRVTFKVSPFLSHSLIYPSFCPDRI